MTEEALEAHETEELVDAPDTEESAEEHSENEPSFVKDWSDADEEEARLLGWKDPDEWQGEKPPGYIDNPAKFLDRLQRSAPFRKMQELSDQKLRKMEAVFEAQNKRIQERAQAEFTAKLEDIRRKQRMAVENADTEEYDRLERERTSIAPPEPDVEQPEGDRTEPYHEKHPWLTDPIMRQHGAAVINSALQAGIVSPTDTAGQIEYAETHVKKYFPHLFPTETATPAPKPKVDGGGLATAKKRANFDSLPRDVREAFSRQVKKGVFEDTKEDREFYYNEYQNG